MLDAAVLGLLHLLVFAYWLGGDLGAFYASRFLVLPGIAPGQRIWAAKIVGDVDMAPRSALILALPTGLALAVSKNWIALSFPILAAVTLLSLIWLWLVWHLHHADAPASSILRRIDIAARWILLFGLIAWALAGLSGHAALPFFIELKLLLLAGCLALGLFIRRVLTPLGPALAGLSGPNSNAAEASLAATLNRARPLVAAIWALLLLAALLGLWTPLQLG